MKFNYFKHAFVASFIVFLPYNHSLASKPLHKRNFSGLSSKIEDPHSSSHRFLIDNNHVTCTKNHEVLNGQNTGITKAFAFNPVNKLKAAIASTFLSSGYPKRTPNGYLSYSVWSWIQDLSTQLRGVLATQRVLEGVGVGREGATALSASLNFIVRDGCGMASTLLFTALASSKFRSDVKRWRLLADISNDIGITLEVCATLVPRHLFLPMICAGNMCKAICGVAAGACNGAINLHWAKGSDISDINAKFGAQHTVTGSLGLIFAALFAKSVSSVPGVLLLSLYTLLTLMHIYANIKCLRLITFDYLNRIRMDMVVNDFLDQVGRRKDKSDLHKFKNEVQLSSPSTISKCEILLFRIIPLRRRFEIQVGSSFQAIYKSIKSLQDDEQISSLLKFYIDQLSRDDYCIVCGVNNEIIIGFAPNVDIVKKINAYLMASMIRKHLIHLNGYERKRLITNLSSLKQFYKENREEMEVIWPIFLSDLRCVGWDISKTQLDSDDYCISIN